MGERIKQHIEQLMAARQTLDAVLDSVGNRWDEPLYSEGAEWTIRQLAIHLMVSGKGFNRMMMAAAKGESIIPEDYDLQRYNKRSVEKRGETSVDEIQESMIADRGKLLAWLETIDDSVLDMTGRHATLEIISIDQWLTILAGHERNHAKDIAAFLES